MPASMPNASTGSIVRNMDANAFLTANRLTCGLDGMFTDPFTDNTFECSAEADMALLYMFTACSHFHHLVMVYSDTIPSETVGQCLPACRMRGRAPVWAIWMPMHTWQREPRLRVRRHVQRPLNGRVIRVHHGRRWDMCCGRRFGQSLLPTELLCVRRPYVQSGL